MIETTLHITSYNRFKQLKSCVESFFATCKYDMSKLQLVVVDNGSTDKETVEYIKNLSPPCADYRFHLNEVNLYPDCLRFAKIQARKMASGNFFFDCPDDHLFLIKDDYITDAIDRIKAKSDVGCVIHFAQPAYRWQKKNNESVLSECGKFAISIHKGYADYHIMSKSVYEDLGEYKYELGRKAEGEYMERSLAAGYKRNVMLRPVAIVNDDSYSLHKAIEKEKYNSHFSSLEGPITNEMLIQFAKLNKSIR
jgi:glycosyltransferase involved in cell wall biosynthesis